MICRTCNHPLYVLFTDPVVPICLHGCEDGNE